MNINDVQPGDQFVDETGAVAYTVLSVEPVTGTGAIPVGVQFADGGSDYRYFLDGSEVPLTRPKKCRRCDHRVHRGFCSVCMCRTERELPKAGA